MSTQIMGIINVSPDSFSGDGIKNEAELRARLARAIADGADLLDIGGQSTRPGAEIISETEEIRRVVPAIELARQLTNLPISVDTYKPVVARAAVRAGATIINDVHGCDDPAMIEAVRDTGVEVVVMHSRGDSQTMTKMTQYPNGVVHEVVQFFEERTKRLMMAGIAKDKIILDPGIGFAKTPAQSFELLQYIDELKNSGFRLLYGASMKSFLGRALADEAGEPLSVEKRVIPNAAVTTYAMLHDVAIIRVHDVQAAMRIRRIVECIEHPEVLA